MTASLLVSDTLHRRESLADLIDQLLQERLKQPHSST